MKINPIYKVRDVAGEHLILLQGSDAGKSSKVIALNKTSLFLWEHFLNKEFQLQDVSQLLQDTYEVDATAAEADAAKWVQVLQSNGILS